MEQEVRLIESNIPLKHRRWDISQLTPGFTKKNQRAVDLVHRYVKFLPENIEEGEGLWLAGRTGTAKSAIACYILDKAAALGKSAYYETAAHITSLKFNEMRYDHDAKAIMRHIVRDVHILAIDELDKKYIGAHHVDRSGSIGDNLFYQFLSEIYNANIALIVCSSVLFDDVYLPDWISDRFKALQKIPLGGGSGRRRASS